MTKSPIKSSLDVLSAAGVIEYTEKHNVLYVTLKKDNLDSVLSELASRNNNWKGLAKIPNVEPGEYSLEYVCDNYNPNEKTYPLLDTFFWNIARYDKKHKMIIVE